MDSWTKVTEFFAAGLLVLPATLGIGFDSFEVFGAVLGLMQIVFIAVCCGAPDENDPPPGNPDKSDF